MVAEKPGSKAVTPLDLHVARRIRERRIQIGMAQQKLAAAVGVTFQQVQKYENGKNRIATGRLQLICDALGVLRDYVYEGFVAETGHEVAGFSDVAAAPYRAGEAPSAAEGHVLLTAFQRLHDPAARKLAIELVTRLADAQAAPTRARKPRSAD